MFFNTPKRKICTVIAATSLALAAGQPSLAESKFAPIKLPAPKAQNTINQQFVRLDLLPVSAWTSQQKSAGKSPSKDEISQYAAELNSQIKSSMASFVAEGFKTSNPVLVSDVGFTVYASSLELRQLLNLTGVKEIVPKHTFSAQRNYSTPWVGAPVAHKSGLTGSGQTIAVIDTGVDYTHADFGGTGNPADYFDNDPAIVEPGTFPTTRVIGGYDLAGFDYDAGDEFANIPQPDSDPLDDGIHGSHVAGIAAGGGINGLLDTGIAPEANILALKVFGANGSTSLTSDAIEMAMDPNGDGDFSDAVDVINMSLGSPFGNPNDPVAVASNNASNAGIVVVASAGNSGNGIPFVSGSPGSAEDVITVASTIAGGVPSFFIPFTTATGERYEYLASYAAISPPLTEVFAGDLAVANPYNACTELTTDMVGKIALITRGSCAFTIKLENALNAGAIGAVVVNSESGTIVMGGTDVDLPAAMISLEDGTQLLSALGVDPTYTELAASNTKFDPTDDNTMSSFSSRGPGPTGLFKPDVSAPGSNIESTLAGSGNGTTPLSGTSMSAPQVAGMAAILREKFPALDPKAIKAIIQNTATPAKDLASATGTPALSLQGTGVINIEKAINATSYVSPGGIGFGRIKPEYNASVTRYMTVTNFSNTDKRYTISIEPNNTLATGAATLTTANEVYLQAGQSQRVEVNLNLNAQAMESGIGYTEMDGWILVTSGDEVMRVGYQSLIDPASHMDYSSQPVSDNVVDMQLRNDAFGEGRVSAFTLTAEGTEAGENAIDAFGYRSEVGGTLLFGLNAKTDWTTFSRKLLTMMIDTDEDGTADYALQVADWSYFDPDRFNGDPAGTIVSALFNLNDTDPAIINNLQYFADAEFNSSILQYRIDAYGADGFLRDGDTTFNYELTMSDRYGDSVEGMLGGRVNTTENVVFDKPDLIVPAQQSSSTYVFGSAPTLWLSPTEANSERAAITR